MSNPGDDEEDEIPFEPGSGEVLGGREHHVPNRVPEDETAVGEQLIAEGLDEALDDEIAEGQKKRE